MRSRFGLALLVLAVLVAAVVAVYIVKFGLAQPQYTRTLMVHSITIQYTGPEALAVIVQSRQDGELKPWAYAMLGGSSGQLNLPQPFPPGAEAVFLLGLSADIAPATPSGAPPVASATLRGISGAHSDQAPLQFRNPKDLASSALKAGGPPVLLRVTSKDGRLVIGDQK